MLRRLYWFSVIIEASLAQAEADVGADAKADQKNFNSEMILSRN